MILQIAVKFLRRTIMRGALMKISHSSMFHYLDLVLMEVEEQTAAQVTTHVKKGEAIVTLMSNVLTA